MWQGGQGRPACAGKFGIACAGGSGESSPALAAALAATRCRQMRIRRLLPIRRIVAADGGPVFDLDQSASGMGGKKTTTCGPTASPARREVGDQVGALRIVLQSPIGHYRSGDHGARG